MSELTRRYIVMTMATEAPFDANDLEGVFVLKPWKDPAALRALQTYRDNCYPELGRDLEAWIRVVEGGAAVRGGVGKRNEPHLKPAASGRRPAAGGRRAGGAAKSSRTARTPPSKTRRSRPSRPAKRPRGKKR